MVSATGARFCRTIELRDPSQATGLRPDLSPATQRSSSAMLDCDAAISEVRTPRQTAAMNSASTAKLKVVRYAKLAPAFGDAIALVRRHSLPARRDFSTALSDDAGNNRYQNCMPGTSISSPASLECMKRSSGTAMRLDQGIRSCEAGSDVRWTGQREWKHSS